MIKYDATNILKIKKIFCTLLRKILLQQGLNLEFTYLYLQHY